MGLFCCYCAFVLGLLRFSEFMAPRKTTALRSSRTQAPAASSSTPRFTSEANRKWYDDHRENKLIVERTVAHDIEASFYIWDAFACLGWDPILDVQGDYYPELVREFYANIADKDEPS